MSVKVFEQIDQLLTQAGGKFDVVEHRAVYTSEEAAEVRGSSLASGAKALLIKVGDAVMLFVMPANRKLDNRKVRDHFDQRRIRFASIEEVLAITGLKPGSIPPFGTLFNLDTVCDPLLGENHSINFNAGEHTRSVSMAFDDYVRIEKPRLLEITQ